METRTLLHTDLTVSRACFGTMTFGAQTDEAAAARMVDCCIDRGVNFFDTANAYTSGASETIVGKLLKGRRQQVVLASKVRFPSGVPEETGLSRGAILKAIDSTLTRLQTDYLDLYYLHAPDPGVPIEESLETMDELARAGKVRYPACSNYAAWQVVEMHSISERRGFRAPYISQPMYNVLARGVEQEYVPMCRKFGVAIVPYNPLAGGLLTGKQPAGQPLPGTRFDKNQLYLDRYWHPAYLDAVEDLRQAAKSSGRSLADIALNWLLHHSAADSIILGASKLEQLQQNLDAFSSGPLADDVLAICDAAWNKLRGVTPRYNR